MLGWYFSDTDEKLRYGDGRKISVGTTHKVRGRPILCERGLHASRTALEALDYAPGPILWRVELSGIIVNGDDKSCATARKYLARVNADPLLREFARKCALKVIHLWDAPHVVRDYLETGDESLRAAAGAAAWDAARDAARAARAAAGAAAGDAAWDAAGAAAWDAARAARAAARAARDAAGAAAWAARAAARAARDAARKEQSELLEQMALAAIAQTDAAQ